jgi:hypothetical protein
MLEPSVRGGRTKDTRFATERLAWRSDAATGPPRGFAGGKLYFEGRPRQSSTSCPDRRDERAAAAAGGGREREHDAGADAAPRRHYFVAHRRRAALVHAGRLRHGATALTRGERANLILWLTR